MPLTKFSDLDFDQIKVQIKNYLRANSNFTDFDFEGSNFSVLIDTLAYNTYISSYNANMVANEVFIDSATLRENVVSLARNIGYLPSSKKASKATVSFFVDTSTLTTNPTTMTLRAGLVAVSDSFGGSNFTFCVPESITVPVIEDLAFFNEIEIYEGTFISKEYTVDDSDIDQQFVIPNSNADTSTLSVEVKESSFDLASVKYELAQSIIDISGTSKIFLLQEITDEKYELLFGDNIFGKRLVDGNVITMSYVITNGDIANGVSNFTFSGRLVDNNNRVVNTGVSAISVNNRSIGGGDIETVSSIRKYAPLKYAAQNRAVTTQDYEVMTKQIFPDTESVSVFGGEDLDPPQYGKVFIAIKPAGGNYLSNFVKSSIISDLKNFTVAGIVPQIIDLKYLYVEVDTNAYYNTNLFPSSEGLKTNIFESLEAYSKTSELNAYGARLKYSKLLAIIDGTNSAITSNITTVRMRRDMRPSVNEFAEYEICFGNRFHVSDGPNIRTSGFLVEGYSGEVFLSDVPYSDGKTGSIDLIRLISPSEKQVLRKNVGTIDYIKGEILLSPIKIINTSKMESEFPIIEIEANPYSNDIIGLQDLFLQLDISKSNVTVIPDTISNGADISGSRYTVSSSFINDNITR
tara:strand:+ start:6808 stop:8706 length:1899 start_codon:yes stop_codon:yes gene_type:complete